MCLTVVGCTCGPPVSVAVLAQQKGRGQRGSEGMSADWDLPPGVSGAPRSQGQLRSVRGACVRHGGVDAVGLPSATAAKVTAVLIKSCQDMLTERCRYITN